MLALVGLLLWQAWQRDYAPALAPDAPDADTPASDAVPQLPKEDKRIPFPEGIVRNEREHVRVRTSVLDVTIDTRGGGVREVRLPQYPVSVERPDQPFVLIDADSAEQSQIYGGVLSQDGPSPTHNRMYRAERTEYSLDGGEEVEVPLYWEDDEGPLSVVKTYVFRRDSYLVDVNYRIANRGPAAWSGRVYGQMQRTAPNRGWTLAAISYTGTVISSPAERYRKIDFDELLERPVKEEIADGWAAFLRHYFLTALIPADKTRPYRYYSLTPAANLYAIGSLSPPLHLSPTETTEIGHRLYLGPKIQGDLAKIASGLDKTVDYGWLWFISKFLFIVLVWLQGFTGNWGISIILLTVLVKLSFYHLSATSYRSMAEMRRLQPRLAALKERFGDDRARLQQAMMQIYREEKINPLSGCFPILVQIPVFIALYWVLLESVELRQARFALWIQDLSVRDPYFVLPLLMGASMFIQQRLSPQPPDPVQRKMLAAMPVVFTLFIAFFPAGLVLYWTVNNVLSIAQQWYIMRRLEAEATP